MPSVPSTSDSESASRSNFAAIFNAALNSYRLKTKIDLASHPLLPSLQHCHSADAFLSVLGEQIPTFNQSQNSDDQISKRVIPTVKVLNAFSDTIGQVVGLAFPPASIIFAGIGVLLSAAEDSSACQDKLIEVFNLIFPRLEKRIGIKLTPAMTGVLVEIMVEVINILAIATKQMKSGPLKRMLNTMIGNSDIEDSLNKLDRLTREEAWMSQAEQAEVTQGIDKKITGVGKRMKGIDERAKGIEGEVRNIRNDLQDDRRNQQRDRLRRWLSGPDPSINHNIACKARHEDTSQWFFEGGIFNQWKSQGSLLWVHGKPGSGKSVLCSSIIKHVNALHDAGTAMMAYFYFDTGDVNKRNLRNLLPSLLVQLSARSDLHCDMLSELYVKYDRGVRKPSDRDMVECLKKMLCLEKQPPTYIIVDALDECPITSAIPGIPSPRRDVLKFVDELVRMRLPNLHICVTSRPEHDIQAVLKHLTVFPVSLHDETGQQKDIANYIASFVRSDPGLPRLREDDKNLVIKTLSEKADGMFRWAFCQLEFLQDCLPPSIRRFLKELPKSLDETYERILKEIREPNREHARRLLQCLVSAARPLRVEELAELLAFDFDEEKTIPELHLDWRLEDQEEAIISTCSSLIIVVKDEDSRVVRFSHSSVKEFLTEDRLRLAEPGRDHDLSSYYIRLDTAHTVLARACLGVLLQMDDDMNQNKMKKFPLALYSAQYWTEHAQFQDVSSYIKDGMECLFDADKPHLATWLWIYNDDQLGRSMSTVRPEKPEAVPLYYAASFGFRDLAEHLIAKHPEDAISKGGKEVTAMHAASRVGYADILRLLLEHGADVDGLNTYGHTPLHRAAWTGKVDAGNCLLDNGANIEALSLEKATPLFWTVIQGHTEFARMLLKRGAAIDARNVTFTSPLHWAVQGGEIQTVQVLLDYGADVHARNKFDEDPCQLASGPDRQEIVKLLCKHGAEYVENVPMF